MGWKVGWPELDVEVRVHEVVDPGLQEEEGGPQESEPPGEPPREFWHARVRAAAHSDSTMMEAPGASAGRGDHGRSSITRNSRMTSKRAGTSTVSPRGPIVWSNDLRPGLVVRVSQRAR